ncbi:hypothetical protein SPI_05920 [Niveomyces insectorum RCEF 264]|uniref:Uncharacterized protein n=1 Tax=Niveomyces insectorum RCEF 264 TaxID=1081102 RepID=A0A167SL42_9HYPO|nr:hypothetical protein SPI_05920 [Niveomyces insectorum RCEF 264]
MFGDNPQEIAFSFNIHDQTVRSYQRTEEDDLTLQEFKAWVTNMYKLPGLVSVFHSGRKLVDLYTTLREVFAGGKTRVLDVYFDKSVAVASGGVVMSSYAYSKNGTAVAQGGYATGGRADKNGNVYGGKGLGGNAMGGSGSGGEGLGGIASTTRVCARARSGGGVGGSFQVTEAARGQRRFQGR